MCGHDEFSYKCLGSKPTFSSNEEYSDVYTGGNAPGVFGARVPEKRIATPLYCYGWIVPRSELYEAINGKPAFTDIFLSRIYIGAGRLLADWWIEKGYNIDEFGSNAPSVKEFNSKHVVIFMGCNESDSLITSVVETKKFQEECRACLGNPKTMESEPVWIRVGMRYLPRELSGTAASNVDQQV